MSIKRLIIQHTHYMSLGATKMSVVMGRLSSLFFFVLVHVILLVSTRSKAKSEDSKKLHQVPIPLFLFGDSFLDSGNNNYINTSTLDQANFWPYGETYFKFPTGRFSDGRLISDFIAQYANLPLIPPYLQPGLHQYHFGVNFASAGSGALVETFRGSVIGLQTQLRYYKRVEAWFRHKFGDTRAKKKLSEAVYMFSIGTNDYTSPFLTNSKVLNTTSNSKYVGMVIGNLTTVIKEIYKSAGRKFVFLNLPDLGCLPSMRIIKPENNGKCLEETSSLANHHNRELSKLLVQLEKQLRGLKYLIFNLNRNVRQRMENPSKYGFKVGKMACCGAGKFRGIFSCGGKRPYKKYELCDDPSKYVFWDSFHLSEKVHKQVADQMWRGIGNHNNLIGSYNMKQLFHCP